MAPVLLCQPFCAFEDSPAVFWASWRLKPLFDRRIIVLVQYRALVALSHQAHFNVEDKPLPDSIDRCIHFVTTADVVKQNCTHSESVADLKFMLGGRAKPGNHIIELQSCELIQFCLDGPELKLIERNSCVATAFGFARDSQF